MDRRSFVASMLALPALSVRAAPQPPFPVKPVRLIVPFSAGSQTDVLSRLVGQKLTELWGEQVVVDNRPSAGGTIALQTVASAQADGYTLLTHSSGYAIAPAMYPGLKLDMLRDFQAISTLVTSPHVVVVSPQLGPRSLGEFIEFARSRGDRVNFSSGGIASSTHLAGEKFKARAQLKMVHVPFRGTPEAMTDVVAMRSHVFFAPLGPALPFVRDGRLVALAVTTKSRSPILPDVPTVHESGLPGFDYDLWFVMAAPARVPRPIVSKLSADLLRVLDMPDVRDRVAGMGAAPKPLKPDAAQDFVRAEIAELGRIVRESGAKPE